jgi:signal transduction histidine kinase
MNSQADSKPDRSLDLRSITRVAIHSARLKEGMDEIVRALRSEMIFDNLVTYAIDSDAENLDVVYARALGRGKSAGPDASWGEDFASQVMQLQKTLTRVSSDEGNDDRLKQVHLLGVPLRLREALQGALIFIRFGGPEFTEDDIIIAEFVATQVAILVKIQKMDRQIQALETQNQAAQLQEDFINTITHELRSPLGFIKGYTTTLLRSDTDWNEKTQKEFLAIIDQETDNLQDLIGNLLDSARLQSGQLPMDFQAISLDSIMNGVVQRIKSYHPDMKILIELDPKTPKVKGDSRRLAQVFENLLGNAVKYAPGTNVLITMKPDNASAVVFIRDYGPGIAPEYLPHLFDRFFRVPDQSPTVHGSGLGLFICKQILDAHGGIISAESELGEGTTFKIWLPSPVGMFSSQ